MTETPTTTEVATQYAVQVSDDLERNARQQEQVTAEITRLQEQLTALQSDHNVLVSIQQALANAMPAPAVEGTVLPPRKKAITEAAGGKRTQAKKNPATTPSSGRAAKPTAVKSATPTLVEIVRRHLATQSEPRSASEISGALNQAHPERRVKTPVVRGTLEGLVAKRQAQRTKQGPSVFYAAPDATRAIAASAESAAMKAE